MTEYDKKAWSVFENGDAEDDNSTSSESSSDEEEMDCVDVISREISKRIPAFPRTLVRTRRKLSELVLKALKRLDSAGRIDLVDIDDKCIYSDVIVQSDNQQYDDEQIETSYKASKILTVTSKPFGIRETVNVRSIFIYPSQKNHSYMTLNEKKRRGGLNVNTKHTQVPSCNALSFKTKLFLSHHFYIETNQEREMEWMRKITIVRGFRVVSVIYRKIITGLDCEVNSNTNRYAHVKSA